MSETDASQRKPFLSGLTRPGRRGRPDGAAGVQLREICGCAMASVVARKGQVAALIDYFRSHYGLEPPAAPRCEIAGATALIGMGPERWLAVAGAEAAAGFVPRLAGDLQGVAAIAEQSDAYAVIEIAGSRARDTLARGTALDLHPRAFGPGDAAATMIAHTAVLLWQVDARPAYRIAVPESWARSFFEFLTANAEEFGSEILPS